MLSSPNLKRYAPILICLAIGIILVAYVVLEVLADSSNHSGGVSLTRTVASWGYSGVFSLMLLEASSLPIPSEIILPFAGYLVSSGHLDFILTLLVATVAALAGSLIDYYIGLKGVEALTKYRLLGRAVFSESQLKVAANYFYRYGAVMVFVGRLIPVVRTLISFPAGAVKMPLAKFVGYTLAGCLIWNSLLIYVGFYLGGKWHEVSDFSHYIVIAVAVAAVGVFVWYLLWRRNKRRRAQEAIKYVT
ncbi:MAG: DedA family protein [Candidatus Bathyarchaeota archaeon]|nr:DedA family protein [Candidatus Bathyarchaeota archaeon]